MSGTIERARHNLKEQEEVREICARIFDTLSLLLDNHGIRNKGILAELTGKPKIILEMDLNSAEPPVNIRVFSPRLQSPESYKIVIDVHGLDEQLFVYRNKKGNYSGWIQPRMSIGPEALDLRTAREYLDSATQIANVLA